MWKPLIQRTVAHCSSKMVSRTRGRGLSFSLKLAASTSHMSIISNLSPLMVSPPQFHVAWIQLSSPWHNFQLQHDLLTDLLSLFITFSFLEDLFPQRKTCSIRTSTLQLLILSPDPPQLLAAELAYFKQCTGHGSKTKRDCTCEQAFMFDVLTWIGQNVYILQRPKENLPYYPTRLLHLCKEVVWSRRYEKQ